MVWNLWQQLINYNHIFAGNPQSQKRATHSTSANNHFELIGPWCDSRIPVRHLWALEPLSENEQGQNTSLSHNIRNRTTSRKIKNAKILLRVLNSCASRILMCRFSDKTLILYISLILNYAYSIYICCTNVSSDIDCLSSHIINQVRPIYPFDSMQSRLDSLLALFPPNAIPQHDVNIDQVPLKSAVAGSSDSENDIELKSAASCSSDSEKSDCTEQIDSSNRVKNQMDESKTTERKTNKFDIVEIQSRLLSFRNTLLQ